MLIISIATTVNGQNKQVKRAIRKGKTTNGYYNVNLSDYSMLTKEQFIKWIKDNNTNYVVLNYKYSKQWSGGATRNLISSFQFIKVSEVDEYNKKLAMQHEAMLKSKARSNKIDNLILVGITSYLVIVADNTARLYKEVKEMPYTPSSSYYSESKSSSSKSSNSKPPSSPSSNNSSNNSDNTFLVPKVIKSEGWKDNYSSEFQYITFRDGTKGYIHRYKEPKKHYREEFFIKALFGMEEFHVKTLDEVQRALYFMAKKGCFPKNKAEIPNWE